MKRWLSRDHEPADDEITVAGAIQAVTEQTRKIDSRRRMDGLLSGTVIALSPGMSKRRKSKRPVGLVDRSASTDIVTQLKCAVRHPQAAALGAVIGGMVPWFARTLAHEEIPDAWSDNRALAGIMIAVVLGCAVFSALTVYKFGRAAFGDARKALGFVLALEGVMLVSHGSTSTVALALLVAINALANGSVIALAHDATQRRNEADARRSVTRARNREAAKAKREQTPMAAPSPVQDRYPSDSIIDAEIVSESRWLVAS